MARKTGETPLRVGLAVTQETLSDPYSRDIIERLEQMGCVDLACCIEVVSDVTPIPKPVHWGLTLEAVLTRTERGAQLDPGSLDVPVVSATGPVPELDLILDLTGSAAVEDLAKRSLHGVWRLTTIDDLSGVRAAVTGAPVTPVALSGFLADHGRWQLLAETAFDTKFLATRNQKFQRAKSLAFLEGQLARLALGDMLDPPAQPSVDSGTGAPGWRDLPGYLRTLSAATTRRSVDKLRARAGGRPGRFCLRLAHGTMLDFSPVSAIEFDAPAGQYWADPFLITQNADLYVFFEVFDYKEQRGHIAVGLVQDDALKVLGVALKTPYHLSYPFVFHHADDIFMIPETHETERLELWRATDFPLGWTLHSTALEGVRTSDSTLAEIDGHWWLFTNLCRDRFNDFCSELHLFQVDGPTLGGLAPHPLNPVVVGSRTARGGGRILRQGGKLLRPSQDNSHGTYGYGLNINEIEVLEPTRYRERLLRRITPPDVPGVSGIHHVDMVNGRVMFDVRKL